MNLFSYNTICTQLKKETKTLIVTLNRPETKNPITLENLFEIQSLLNWASTRLEIQSILFNSSADTFSIGIDQKTIESLEFKKLSKIREEIYNTHKLMLNSPQTIIFDLGHEAKNIALELSMGADIRVASVESKLAFNELEIGFTPLYSIRLAEKYFTKAELHNFTHYTKNIELQKLSENGFLLNLYDSSNQTEILESILENICLQAPLSRVQTKFLYNRRLITKMDQDFNLETTLFNAACSTQDWREKKFSDLQNIKKAVKMTLIHGGAEQ